jgi:protein SCO1/2
MVRKRIFHAVLLMLGAYVLAGCAMTQASVDPKQQFSSVASVIDPPLPVSDFTLTNQQGKPTSLNELRGKLALVYVGYTNCADVCPTAMANFTRVKQALGSKADQAAFVFISIDPTRDTPEVLTQYLSVFDPAFIALTGDLAATQQVAKAFQTTFLPHPDGKVIDHSERIYLLNKQGNIRITYQLDALPAAIASDMKILSGQ